MTTCILIVEDDPDIQALLRETLEDHGYRTVSSQGMDASALARSEQPDLVLLDLFLHETSGGDVQGQLRADARTAAIPVIVISALSQAVHLAAAMGADGVLQKPFSITSLQRMIDRALCTAQQRKDARNGS